MFTKATSFNINNLPNNLTERQINEIFIDDPENINKIKKVEKMIERRGDSKNLLLTIGQNSINRIDDYGNTLERDRIKQLNSNSTITGKNLNSLNAVSDSKDILNNIKSYFGGKRKTCRKTCRKKKSHRKSPRKIHRKSPRKRHRKII
jgi:hypothetical protein